MNTTKLTIRRLAIAVCVLVAPLALSIAIPTALAADRSSVPPTGGQRYPLAFHAYMGVNYGPQWMHTVQEEMVRRIYRSWLIKEYGKSDKERR